MGTWGIALFSDDTARDVRQGFVDLLRHGATAEEAVEQLKNDWADAIADSDDGPSFWLALAATQWAYGCLNDEVKRKAIGVIDSGEDLARWTGRSLDRRREVLASLRAQLESPQPKLRRPRRQKQVDPLPTREAFAPDGLGRAVAFSIPGASVTQVLLERVVGTSKGGGNVFVAECRYDAVDLEWLPGGALQVTYPESANVQQQAESHFYRGEVIPIVYRVKAG